MAGKAKIDHEGKAYYGVEATARMLSMTKSKVRELMGSGDLRWVQLSVGGPLFVSAESIVAWERRK